MACKHEYWQMVLVPPDDCDHECFCDITGQSCTSSYESDGKGNCDPEAVKRKYKEERFRDEQM